MKLNRLTIIYFAVLLLLVGVTTIFVASTYAKYVSEVPANNGSVTVAKWAFTTDNPTQTLQINLAETYHASTLVSQRIAPGTQGSFNVALSNATSEVGVDFTVKLNTITNKPTNLKFYKDQALTTELTPGTSTITGQIAVGENITVPIYWAWAYETTAIATNDPIDTTDGEAGATLSIGVDITGVQTQPSTTAITTHIN